MASARYHCFGNFSLDTQTRELRAGDGTPVPLTAKAFDTLCVLIENRQRVVSKDELLATVWAGRVVEENNLTQAISALRRALGGNASDHRYIVTVPGRGYRFVAELQEASVEAMPSLATSVQPPAAVAQQARARSWRVRPGLVLSGLLALALVAAAASLALRPRDAVQDVAAANVPAGAITRPVPQAPTTLAVLPFRSLSAGPRDEGLELGLADTLITRLSHSRGLQVASLASVQRFSDGRTDIPSAARQLGADYIVEGTTQRNGDQVRINARLVQAANGRAVWGDTFDARIDRVFTVQDKLGDAVTSALAIAPVRRVSRATSPCDGEDADAYRAYLRGYYQLMRPSEARMLEALAAFREAIDRDPTCARAWAGTAYAYRALAMTGDRDPREIFPLAKAAVERALAIDPDSAEAYSAKGFIEFWYDWDWQRAEASLRHAIALNPNLAEAQIAMAHLLANIGRAPEAVPYARRAVALDPLSPIVNGLAGSFLAGAGETEEAQKHLQKTVELEPEAWVALRVSSGRAQARNDRERAVADLRRAVEISGGHSNTLAGLGALYAAYGDRAAAEQVLAELEARRRKGYLPATSLAVVVAALGDTNRALDLLELGYRERDIRMSFLLVDWRGLRGEPRYQALLKRMRLPADKPGAG